MLPTRTAVDIVSELILFAEKKVAATIVATPAATVFVDCVVIVPFVVSNYRILRSRPRHSRSRSPRLLRRLRQDFVVFVVIVGLFNALFAVTVVVVELVVIAVSVSDILAQVITPAIGIGDSYSVAMSNASTAAATNLDSNDSSAVISGCIVAGGVTESGRDASGLVFRRRRHFQ